MMSDEMELQLMPLASLHPPSSSRAWQTAPHPYLPLAATACSDKTVRIYSLTSFTCISTITGGHRRSVRCSAWKPGIKGDRESILATGSFDATAAIWAGRNDTGKVGAVDPDTSIGGEEEDQDDVDDEEDWRFAVVLEGHDSEIKSVDWSCHGTYLATCGRDKSVWIWEALDAGPGGGGDDDDDNYETVAVLQEHEGDVKCLRWHPTEESCLASGSYDEAIRVWREDVDGEWTCVASLAGHDGTVWSVDWEPSGDGRGLQNGGDVAPAQDDGTEVSGPRILSCSDDLTIRLWRRKPKAKPKLPTGPRIPSIIRSSSDEEDWYEEAQLPQRHERAVYSVAWSKKSKRVASAGSDGKIIVYEERAKAQADGDTVMTDGPNDSAANGAAIYDSTNSEWVVVAELEAAHGVFEVNHVCWARRCDRGRTSDDEEIILSTGDDGEVKAWALETP